MKGKILGAGAISGADGNRYDFDIADIENLNGKTQEQLVGAEVDFEVVEDSKSAKSIFVTSTNLSVNLDVNDIKERFSANDAQGVRFKFLMAIVLYAVGALFAFIPFLGFIVTPICSIAAIVIFVLATLRLNSLAESRTLFKNFLYSIVIGIVASVVAGALGGASLIRGSADDMGVLFFVAVAILVVGFIASFVFYAFYMREMAFVMQQKFILYSFWCNLVGVVLAVLFIGYILIFVAFVLFVIGVYQFREVRKRTENDVIPWF
ncbi:hypothetical protein [Helicobacter typhlonius]|uniref:2-amino-4-hydroxy-6-hydroxymethyldihydropteridine pyrophosphokinase n=3 Tax=Helicobacter TaxID=209 RepID=A0A099UHN7_9HELI|nr:hypothetical protein [Helicobacter typhlonius]TLD77792.1 2-amino-4-hydroxy-6-hydroxymethyldihydropteridine pyrophosphokinase [Helicobacter typhlonius]CUU39810.1 Hypothetical protein BN2458_PEG0925 [Helicobacter typhlonius]